MSMPLTNPRSIKKFGHKKRGWFYIDKTGLDIYSDNGSSVTNVFLTWKQIELAKKALVKGGK
jgi:hypothetical protein